MCTLDAFKAFNRVNLLLLFSKLLQRHMRLLFLRFLMSTYCNQQMRVKWNGTTSNTFSTFNGLQHCGVFSPILFNVCINELILLLSEQGVGCCLHGQLVGASMYANDVTLLAPTSTALNAVVKSPSGLYQYQFHIVVLHDSFSRSSHITVV